MIIAAAPHRPSPARLARASKAAARTLAHIAACACCALWLGGCGRLGFDPFDLDDDGPSPHRDGGRGPSGDGDGSPPGSPGSDSGEPSPSAEAGMQPGMDAAPLPGMDAAVDSGPGADAMADAMADAAADGDAGGGDAAMRCALPSASSFCDALPSLPDPPVIDGVLECGLTLQPVPVQDWTDMNNPVPADHSARWAAAWRPDGLYVFVDVDDGSRLPAISTMDAWCGDGVEVYVDDDASYAAVEAYDDPGTVQLVAVAPDTDTTKVVRGDRYRQGATLTPAWTGSGFATFPKAGGYVLEAFVVAADLDLASWTLAAGQHVGLDLGINLSISSEPAPPGETADCGRRLGQYFMRIDESYPQCMMSLCMPWRNPSAYCSPALLQ